MLEESDVVCVRFTGVPQRQLGLQKVRKLVEDVRLVHYLHRSCCCLYCLTFLARQVAQGVNLIRHQHRSRCCLGWSPGASKGARAPSAFRSVQHMRRHGPIQKSIQRSIQRSLKCFSKAVLYTTGAMRLAHAAPCSGIRKRTPGRGASRQRRASRWQQCQKASAHLDGHLLVLRNDTKLTQAVGQLVNHQQVRDLRHE